MLEQVGRTLGLTGLRTKDEDKRMVSGNDEKAMAATPVEAIVRLPFEPYYDQDGITIYNADCRKVLPWLERFDLLLTDPPYGIGEDGGAQRTRGSKRKNGPKMGWDATRPGRSVFELMIEAADTHIIWGGNYFADMLPATRGWLYWEKLMGGDFSDGELAWTSRDAVLKQFTKAKQTSDRLHPTQKPLAVIQWCLSLVPEARSVLDPFMGSGTTLVAAKVHGLKAVGIEINRTYCEAAVNRLKQKTLWQVKRTRVILRASIPRRINRHRSNLDARQIRDMITALA